MNKIELEIDIGSDVIKRTIICQDFILEGIMEQILEKGLIQTIKDNIVSYCDIYSIVSCTIYQNNTKIFEMK